MQIRHDPEALAEILRLDWQALLWAAIDRRPESWEGGLKAVREWQNASDQLCAAVLRALKEESMRREPCPSDEIRLQDGSFVRKIWPVFVWRLCAQCGLDFRRERGYERFSERVRPGYQPPPLSTGFLCGRCADSLDAAAQLFEEKRMLARKNIVPPPQPPPPLSSSEEKELLAAIRRMGARVLPANSCFKDTAICRRVADRVEDLQAYQRHAGELITRQTACRRAAEQEVERLCGYLDALFVLAHSGGHQYTLWLRRYVTKVNDTALLRIAVFDWGKPNPPTIVEAIEAVLQRLTPLEEGDEADEGSKGLPR